MRRLLASSFILMLASACGDVYVDPFTAGEQSSGVPRVDVPIADAAFPEPPTLCPMSMPRANDPCELTGSVCEYGWSADKNCNTIFRCAGEAGNGYWMRVPGRGDADGAGTCSKDACAAIDTTELDGKDCELPMGEAGTISDTDELICNVNDSAICACTTGPNGDQTRKWVCKRPISDCPGRRPLIGQTCTSGLWCDYGACDYKNGLVMQCLNGRWSAGGRECD